MSDNKDVCIQIEGGLILFECPACECCHVIDPARWTFNGDMVRPTVSPSILVRGTVPITDDEVDRIMSGETIELVPTICHSFVRDGQIEFLGDCTHKLAGRTVPLEPI